MSGPLRPCLFCLSDAYSNDFAYAAFQIYMYGQGIYVNNANTSDYTRHFYVPMFLCSFLYII